MHEQIPEGLSRDQYDGYCVITASTVRGKFLSVPQFSVLIESLTNLLFADQCHEDNHQQQIVSTAIYCLELLIMAALTLPQVDGCNICIVPLEVRE